MVPLIRIGLTTPSLPMTCSTTELQRHKLSISQNNTVMTGSTPPPRCPRLDAVASRFLSRRTSSGFADKNNKLLLFLLSSYQ